MMQLFTLNYWVGFPAFISTPFLVMLLIIFAGAFFGGIVVMGNEQKIQNRLLRQVALRASHTAVWIGGFGLFFTFTRYERAPLFMYRFWFLILGVLVLMQIYRIRQYSLRRKTQLDEETRRYETRGKYLAHK
jgi:uncharacterized integral membrane protein